MNIFLFAAALYVAVQAPFHWNLRLLIIVVLSQYYMSLFSRAGLISFQLKLLPVQGTFESDPVVLWCTFCRSYYMGVVCNGITNIFIERCFATVLVADYERKPRRYIGITLSVITVTISALLAPTAVYEIIPSVIAIGIIVPSSVIATSLFLLLLYKNQRRYRRLNEDHRISCGTLTMHYTLSIRFQLNENLRSMKLLRNIIIMCGLLNILGLILYTGVRIKWLHFYSDIVAHYYDAFFNITLAVYATSIPIIAYLSDDTYKNIARTMPVFGKLVRVRPTTTLVEGKITADDCDVYFRNLQQQWDGPSAARNTNKINLR